MIEITIKTLDSRNHEFSVEDDLTVKQLKEQIAESVRVPAESQRLIYCGRVLLDDKKLSEYDVNGKVIHLVQRAPPSSSSGGSGSSTSASGGTGRNGDRSSTRARLDNAMYLGAMAFPADLMDAQGLTIPPARHTLSQSRLGVARAMLRRANVLLQSLEGRSENGPLDSSTPAEPSPPAEPAQEVSVQAEVTISSDPSPIAQADTNNTLPGPEQIAAVAAEAVTAAIGHALNVHHAGNVSITVNNGDGSGPDDLVVRVTQGSGPSSGTTGTQARPRSAAQRTTALADLVSQLREVQRRMLPYLDRYHILMRDDPVETNDSQQVLFNQVSELMHVLAHAYHALSDIMCDLRQPPPRVLRCRPVLIQHSAVLQTGIPIQHQIINLSSQPNNNAMDEVRSGTPAEAQSVLNPPQPSSEAEEIPTPAEVQPQADVPQNQEDAVPRTEEEPSESGSRPERTGGSQPGHTTTVSISPSNLEIFMDVSSGSITFDAVEATVLHAPVPPNTNATPSQPTSNNQANSGDQPPWSQAPPADFIQNLFQRFYEMSNIHNNNYNNNNNNSGNNSGGSASSRSQQPAAAATAAASSGTTSQNQASSSSGTPNTTNNTTESETSSTQAQTQAQAQVQTTPTTNTTGTSSNNTSSASLPRASFSRPHIHIGNPHIQTLDFFDPYLPCNSHHIRGRRRGGASSAASSTASEPQQPQQQQQRANDSATNPPTAPEANASVSSTSFPHPTVQMSLLPPGPNRARSIVHHIIPIMPREMGGSGIIGRTTVAQLIDSIPGRQPYAPGQSLIMDFFMTAGRNVMLQDIVLNVSPAMLGWMRPGLQEYLTNTLGVDQTCPEAAIQTAVDRINAELTPFFETPFEGLTMREDIDLPASIRKVIQVYVPQLIKDIHQADNFTTYTVSVSQLVLKIIRGIISVLRIASQTPRINFNPVLIAFSRKLVQGSTAEGRNWLVDEVAQRLNQVVRSVDLPRDFSRQFIVNIPPPPQSDVNLQPMPMEIEETVSAPQEVVSSSLSHSEPLPNILIGSEQWHHELPSEWVPIITRDKERQRRGANQGPLSDAYLAGMPSKRRKLLTDAKPNSSLNKVISESMGRALGAAGLASSGAADLMEAAACDSGLRKAYKAQVRSSVESTLRSHPDYHPDKYPNTAKYFDRLHRS